MDVTVRALKAFMYRGADIKRDDLVLMDLDDAKLYERYSFVIGSHPPQTYQTRELTAR